MNYDSFFMPVANGTVRILSQQEELPLLRDHLLRLDQNSRHDRFHGFIDDSFIERYAAHCANDGVIVIAYFEDGVVRGAAELHPPHPSTDGQPEVAFSVEESVRRKGVGSILFRKLIKVARAKDYNSLRITTGAQNEAMRALASKFGAELTFHHGESSGSIDLTKHEEAVPAYIASVAALEPARALANLNRAYWRMVMQVYGWEKAA